MQHLLVSLLSSSLLVSTALALRSGTTVPPSIELCTTPNGAVEWRMESATSRFLWADKCTVVLEAGAATVLEAGCFTELLPVLSMEAARGAFTLRTGALDGASFVECTVNELHGPAPSAAEQCSSPLTPASWRSEQPSSPAFTARVAVASTLPACSTETELW